MKTMITKRHLDTIRPEVGKTYCFIQDTGQPGLEARIHENGSVTWLIRFTFDGKRKRHTIGTYPTWPILEARKKARIALAAVEEGNDPTATTKPQETPSLGDFWHRDFLPDASGRWKPRTLVHHEWLWERRIKEHLQHIKVDQIDAGTLRSWHKEITADGATVANGALRLVRSILGVAEQWGKIPQGTNPAALVRPNKERTRDRYLTPEEIDILFKAIEHEERAGGVASIPRVDPGDGTDRRKAPESASRGISKPVACLFRSLFFTGCRKSELLGAQWSQVDFDRGLLTLEDAKAGRRIVALAAPVIADLQELYANRTGPWVFEGHKAGRPVVNTAKPWARVLRRADNILAELRKDGKTIESNGFAGLRIHDTRHSAASTLISAGYSLGTVAAALGHKSLESVRRYAHLQPSVAKGAADALAELYGNARDGAKVVDLGKEDRGTG